MKITIFKEELIELLRGLADSLEQKDIEELTADWDFVNEIEEGPSEDGWRSYVQSGKRSVSIHYRYTEKTGE